LPNMALKLVVGRVCQTGSYQNDRLEFTLEHPLPQQPQQILPIAILGSGKASISVLSG
jgi:hypothetical protein